MLEQEDVEARKEWRASGVGEEEKRDEEMKMCKQEGVVKGVAVEEESRKKYTCYCTVDRVMLEMKKGNTRE